MANPASGNWNQPFDFHRRVYEVYADAAREAGKNPEQFLREEGLKVLTAYLRVQKDGNELYVQNPVTAQTRKFTP